MSAADYQRAVLASAPVAYWPLNDPVGHVAGAELVAGRSASLYMGAALGAPDPWGDTGALDLTAKGLAAPALTPLIPLASFTIEAWQRQSPNPPLAHVTLVYYPEGEIWFKPGSAVANGAVRLWGNYVFTAARPVGDDRWHHWAFTLNGTAAALYLDGALLETATVPAGGAPSNNAPGIGATDLTANWPLTGYIAGVAVFDRALSAGEISLHYNAQPAAVGPSCVRRAWVTLPDGRSMPFEGKGYGCTKLDLASPTIRDVTTNRPDNNGTFDWTRYLGSRLVSAEISALSTVARTRIDEVAAAFAPFMDPAQRPTLHYVLDRDDNPERTLVLRASAYSAPIAGPIRRDIQLQWIAPDPLALDPVAQTATSWANTGVGGRTYPLQFDRAYVSGGGGAQSSRIVTAGDVWIRPTFRIYGPISSPNIAIQPDGSGSDTSKWLRIPFLSAFRIDAGSYVTVNSDTHEAYLNGDPTQNVLSNLDWYNLRWPVLYPGTGYTMTISGTGVSGASQVQATWHDRYLV